METLHPALKRLREYRNTLDAQETIDPVGGLSAADLDVILSWGEREDPDADATLASISPPALRIAGRPSVVIGIVLICVLIYRYMGM